MADIMAAITGMTAHRWLRVVLRGQAAFYVLSGLWPLAHMRSFELVTGPKTDDWLVQMVGLLAASIGLAILVGTRPVRVAGAVVTLAIATAASFAAIDITHALSGRISRIYLADAAVEIALVMLVAGCWLASRRDR